MLCAFRALWLLQSTQFNQRRFCPLLLQALFMQYDISYTKRQTIHCNSNVDNSSSLCVLGFLSCSPLARVFFCVFCRDSAPLTFPILHPSEAQGGNNGLVLMRSYSVFPTALGIPPSLQEHPLERVCVILMWDLGKRDKVLNACVLIGRQTGRL